MGFSPFHVISCLALYFIRVTVHLHFLAIAYKPGQRPFYWYQLNLDNFFQ